MMKSFAIVAAVSFFLHINDVSATKTADFGLSQIDATKNEITAIDATTSSPQLNGFESIDLDEITENVEESDNQMISTTDIPNLIINYTTAHYDYYNSTIYVNKAEAKEIWSKIKDAEPNDLLSNSHRRAKTVALKFVFPFYGYNITNVTVSTGGFLFTGEYVHSWLATTQYIAPLMANFDTSLLNNSFVRLNDNGTAFTVVWENVSLQDELNPGNFIFSATLHQSGDIVFTYFNIPMPINAIDNANHPVKIGLADAYLLDKQDYNSRRKTIYEYHRVDLLKSTISNATIIRLTALKTCLKYTNCSSCIQHETTFDCTWCPILNWCSNGFDRKRQQWLKQECDQTNITSLALCSAAEEGKNNTHDDEEIDKAQIMSK